MSFGELMGRLRYPMFIVTTAAGGERSGCLVGFTTQTSIRPSRFLVCLSVKNHTHGVALRADSLCVHQLAIAERDLADLFGGETGDDIDKFEHCEWTDRRGVPVLDGCPNWFIGRILERLDLGDHTGFLLDPIESHKGEDEPELDFQEVRDIAAGHPV
jgi:flavin reductase (DIM6/NTAB) family NADH-FMN oxidoreductase RutF